MNLKKASFLATLSICLFSTNIMAETVKPIKMGYINTQYLFKNHPKNVSIKEKFKEKFKADQNQLFEKEATIKKLENDLKDKSLKPAVVTEKTNLLEVEKREYSSLLSKLRAKVDEEQRKESEILLKEIQNTVEIYSQINEYNMIVDSGFVAYADKELDITEEILKKLRIQNSAVTKK